jgi:hypothetical protein
LARGIVASKAQFYVKQAALLCAPDERRASCFDARLLWGAPPLWGAAARLAMPL